MSSEIYGIKQYGWNEKTHLGSAFLFFLCPTVNSAEKPFALSAYTLAAAVPLVLLEPTVAGALLDPVLAVVIPFHMYTACKYVIEDYVPKFMKRSVIYIWTVVSVLVGTFVNPLSFKVKTKIDHCYWSLWYSTNRFTFSWSFVFLLFFYLLAAAGLIKLSMKHGIVNTIKSLWYPAGAYKQH